MKDSETRIGPCVLEEQMQEHDLVIVALRRRLSRSLQTQHYSKSGIRAKAESAVLDLTESAESAKTIAFTSDKKSESIATLLRRFPWVEAEASALQSTTETVTVSRQSASPSKSKQETTL
jgi:hypothetical protein